MNRLDTLDQLINALVSLVTLLALDPGCQWTRKFTTDLERARQLKDGAPNASDLAQLSASVRHGYGGMGSFNDYAPAVYDSATRRYVAIPGTDDFETVKHQVFDLALALVVSTP